MMDAAIFVMLTLVGAHFGLPRDMLPAVAHVESAGNPRPPDSTHGAQGLMQLTPVVQAKYGVRDPYDPAQSAYAAARYLAWGHRHFGSWRLALGAYGCGPGRAHRCQHYARRVIDAMGYEP